MDSWVIAMMLGVMMAVGMKRAYLSMVTIFEALI